MIPYYRPSILDDVYDLAPRLRQADKDEVKASSNLDPLQALLISMQCSEETNSMIASDGEVVGMFGVAPTPDPMLGIPWMLASDRLPELTREFIPQSLEWVIETNNKYPILYNYVAKDNKKAIRWLKYLGFNFTQLVEKFGHGQKPFYEFVRINNV
jgi:hypothetical protein